MRRGTWYFEDDTGLGWVPYKAHSAILLEEAAQSYGKFIVQVSADPLRVVAGTVKDCKQYRRGRNPKPGGRRVLRGTEGRSINLVEDTMYKQIVLSSKK